MLIPFSSTWRVNRSRNQVPYVLTNWRIRTFFLPENDFRLAVDQETRWIVPCRATGQKAGEHETEPFELKPRPLVGSQQP